MVALCLLKSLTKLTSYLVVVILEAASLESDGGDSLGMHVLLVFVEHCEAQWALLALALSLRSALLFWILLQHELDISVIKADNQDVVHADAASFDHMGTSL